MAYVEMRCSISTHLRTEEDIILCLISNFILESDNILFTVLICTQVETTVPQRVVCIGDCSTDNGKESVFCSYWMEQYSYTWQSWWTVQRNLLEAYWFVACRLVAARVV